jgi:BirA family biotin operon repressor/biotin-[acetyl-CoA-carboxylase] ligase
LPSTQEHLKTLLKNNEKSAPLAVTCRYQTQGIGSRGNSWEGFDGNLFVSFALPLEMLPSDLKLESASIYFAYLLMQSLREFGSKLWLKWPNDFYIKDKKIGGMITSLQDQNIVCGFGLNLVASPEEFDILDIVIDKEILLQSYFAHLEKKISWKQVFSNYELEFHANKGYFTHIKNNKIYLNDAKLESDGSLSIKGERMYSLR